MAFTSGTATDYNDLFILLHDYLVAQGWTVDSWTAPVGVESEGLLFITGPGSLGGEQPRCAIKSAYDVDSNIYNWQLHGAINYEGDKGFGTQQYSSPRVFFSLWHQPIDYWFYVNDRRFIVVTKIGTIYHSMYMGFFLPYMLPTQYPFPLYVGGTINSAQPYNLDNSGMRSAFDPSSAGATYFKREGNRWEVFENSYNSGGVSDGINGNNSVIWPYRVPRGDNDPGGDDWNKYGLNNLRPTLEGNMPLWQAQIIDIDDRTMPGMLDGVFVTPGWNRVAEQVVTVGGQDYRLFQSHNRSRGKDFFAIEEA
jgi:hypothetical protein